MLKHNVPDFSALVTPVSGNGVEPAVSIEILLMPSESKNGPPIIERSVILSSGMFCCFLKSRPLRMLIERSVNTQDKWSNCFWWKK